MWATNTVVPAVPAAHTVAGRLLPGQGLMAGSTITSPDGRLKLAMQTDGNLVLYDWYIQALWASKTGATRCLGRHHPDRRKSRHLRRPQPCDLGVEHAEKPGAWLAVQDDGNVVIYDTGNHPLWATDTEIGVEVLT